MDFLGKQSFQGSNKIVTDTIFPTRTPIPFDGDGEKPKKIRASLADRFFEKFSKRIKPIMIVRDALDKVYSKGYFENHYPDADKDLKIILNKEAKIAHSRLLAEDDEVTEPSTPSRTIVININTGG